MTKNILYISYDGMTDQLGQSQVLPYLVGLQKFGYNFHLISCEKPEKFEKQRKTIEDICKGNGITWHPLPYTKSPPVLSTVKDVRQITKKAFDLHRIHKFDMVHCRGYISALVGYKMKKQLRSALLFDMRGLWADEKVDAGSWNLRNPIYKTVYNFFKKKEKQFLENADYTISLTRAAQKEIHSWRHISNNPVKMEVIPCCTDTELFNPAQVDAQIRASIQKELGISDRDTILTYLGSIGSWYMLDEMLDFFVTYQHKYPTAKFLFITGDQHEQIRTRAAERNIGADKILIRPALRKEVPASISLGAHSVFFIRATYSKISSSPTKQAELMSMGIPVISNAGVGDTDLIIKNFKSGVVIGDFTAESYNRSIDELAVTTFDRQAIRHGAEQYFSLTDGVSKYLRVYQSILGHD
ncbi:MAG: glycosyltransferase [Chitinophagaceae bacterium]|nr:glycosyltransferase [Chitinophagaceae bacterium]